MVNPQSPAEFYRAAHEGAGTDAARAERLAERVSWTRLLLAVVVVALLIWGDGWFDSPLRELLVGAGVLLFAAAVRQHGSLSERGRAARQREAAAAAGLARLGRRWQELPPWRALDLPEGWPRVLARDLGVTGEQSLMRLMDVVHPAVGGRRLAHWLLGDPAPTTAIVERQASTVALRDVPALLLAAAAEARHGKTPASSRGIESFRAWSVGTVAGAVSPVSTIVSVVAMALLAGVLLIGDAAVRAGAITLYVTVQLVLSALARRRLERELPGVNTALLQIAGVTTILSLLTGAADVPGALGTIQRRLRETGSVTSLRALARLLAWNEVRYSPMGHWMLNALVGMDVHLARAVSRWRAMHGPAAADWLEDAADAEALLALGTMAFEHPAWCTPELHDAPSDPTLRGRDVAHPVIDPAVAVANDVTLVNRSDVILISGSNMAGKTTFLRAVGLNILLAQAGGVACAKELAARRCRVRSSVRVEDDLAQGVSLFLAEVRRLRDVIHDAELADAPPVFFLFDEILHGTNAGDRRLATRAVMERLAAAPSAGLVTTHDPEIGAAQQIHFDGDVARGPDGSLRLRFDYRSKPGPAERANALQVLEMMGIGSGDS